jgi:hypothetical protein
MYLSANGFSLDNSVSETRKKRCLQERREELKTLNIKVGNVIKTTNGVETVSGFNSFAQIETFSGHRYFPTDIRKVG